MTETMEDQQQDDVDLLEQLADAGSADSGLKLHLRRRSSDGKKWIHLEVLDPPLDLELVRKEWGGGDYEVLVRGPKAKVAAYKQAGGKKLSGVFSIEGTPRIKGSGSTGGTGESAGLAALLERMNDRMDRLEERLRTPAAPPQPPAQEDSLDKALKIIKLLKETTTTAAVPVQSAADRLTEMRELMELGKDLFGGGSGEGMGPYIVEAVKHLGSTVQAAVAAQRQPGAPQPGGREVRVNVEGPLEAVAPYIPRLLDAANNSTPPVSVADVVVANAGDVVQAIRNRVAMTDKDRVIGEFFTTYPETQPQAEWFRELLEALLEEEDPDE